MAVFLIVSEYETLPGHHSDLILDPDESSNCTPQSLLAEVSHDLPSDPYKECHSDDLLHVLVPGQAMNHL